MNRTRNAEAYCTEIGCLLTIAIVFTVALSAYLSVLYWSMKLWMCTVALLAALVIWGIIRGDRPKRGKQ